MKDIVLRFKGVLIALVVLSLSASLTFGAQAPAAGYALGGSFEDNAGPDETAGDENTDEDTETDETTDETTDGTTDGSAQDAGDNCLTDPTALTPDELAAMSHGSIVCWAAHQTEWPAWFANHGKFVSCWAHQGKAGAPSCTEAPVADAAAPTHGNGKGKSHTKGNSSGN